MTIAIWGDSITYGGPTEGWVGLLRKHLAEKDIEVYNRGICGDTSSDIVKRFSIEFYAIEPDVVVFAVGANDSKYPELQKSNKVSLAQYQKNMTELISLARARAKRVILVGFTNIDEAMLEKLVLAGERSSIFRVGEIKSYDDSLKILAKREKIEFINMQGILNPLNHLEDGIHPNLQGYQKMFEVIKKVFLYAQDEAV